MEWAAQAQWRLVVQPAPMQQRLSVDFVGLKISSFVTHSFLWKVQRAYLFLLVIHWSCGMVFLVQMAQLPSNVRGFFIMKISFSQAVKALQSTTLLGQWIQLQFWPHTHATNVGVAAWGGNPTELMNRRNWLQLQFSSFVEVLYMHTTRLVSFQTMLLPMVCYLVLVSCVVVCVSVLGTSFCGVVLCNMPWDRSRLIVGCLGGSRLLLVDGFGL